MTDQHIIGRVMLVTSFYGQAKQQGPTRLEAAEEGWTENERGPLELCNALLDVERWGMQQQWAALERLLAAIPPGGTYEEVRFLPREQAFAAVRDVNTLGWVDRG